MDLLIGLVILTKGVVVFGFLILIRFWVLIRKLYFCFFIILVIVVDKFLVFIVMVVFYLIEVLFFNLMM